MKKIVVPCVTFLMGLSLALAYSDPQAGLTYLGKENRTPGALCDEISRKVNHCTAMKNFFLVEELNKRYGRSWQTETAVNAMNGIQESLNEIDKLAEEISLLVK